MDERPEQPKSSPDWDRVYSERSLAQIPWNSDKPDQDLTELIESGKIRPGCVLDVGCGTGTDAIYLASQGANATGIDVSREAIRIAGERAKEAGVRVNFIASDFFEVEFGNAVFDFVNDRGCFHVMNPSRRQDFVAKVNRVLKDGGCYYLRCWSDKQQFENEWTPYRISKEIIRSTFSGFFDAGEITDFRWGRKGPWGYRCLMTKKK